MFEMENKIKVLLVQDNNQASASKGDAIAQVSIVFNVGSYNDPPDHQGFAHFMEHMVFMGS